MCENGFSQKIKKLQVLKKMLQFNEKVDIKGEDNIIQYRVTAKVKVSEDKKLNSGNEQGNKKISKKGTIIAASVVGAAGSHLSCGKHFLSVTLSAKDSDQRNLLYRKKCGWRKRCDHVRG